MLDLLFETHESSDEPFPAILGEFEANRPRRLDRTATTLKCHNLGSS
jgi:hypothetical protein